MADKLLLILLNIFYLYISFGYYQLFWDRNKERRFFMVVGWLILFIFINVAYRFVSDQNDFLEFTSTLSIILILVAGMIIQNWIRYVFDRADAIQEALDRQRAGYYEKQNQEIERNQKETKRQRHELKNSYITIETMAKQGDTAGIISFVHSCFRELDNPYELVHTGNMAVDSILNYKLAATREWEIRTEQHLNIPEEMNLSPYVICGVLGNGLDNAVEACKMLPKEKRWLSISMSVEKRNLFIELVNTFDGKIRSDQRGIIQSRKEDGTNHGFGLETMRRLLEDQKGTMMIRWENNRFHLQVVIYHVL